MTETKPSLPYRPDIDGLRAIAVLSVIAFHATKRISGGFVGVDVFFVISGYLISFIIYTSLQNGTFSFADFYARRIKRIFPALILVLFTSWVLGWFLLEPASYVSLGKHIVASAAFASNILFWTEAGYFDTAASFKPLLHLWSLGIEEQFYLVLPVFLFLLWKSKKNLGHWIVILLGLSFAINVTCTGYSPVASFYLPFSRFWELLTGAALAYVSLNHRTRLETFQLTNIFGSVERQILVRDLMAFTGIVVILAGIFVVSEASAFPGWWALLPVLGAALMIAAGPGAIINRSVMSSKVMTSIGLISYPLYLWHWPLLTFGRLTSFGIEHPKLTTISMILLAFLLSTLTYHLVEKRVRYQVTSVIRNIVPVLSIFLGLMVVIGAITFLNKGWSSRYPEPVHQFLDYEYDYQADFRNNLCLLSGSEKDFDEECEGTITDPAAPLIMVWGDSHGAMLFQSLRQAGRLRNISVAQYTSSSCPPILNFEKANRPLCKSINDAILKKIVDLKPDTIVMAHDWPQSVGEGSLNKLPATVAKLRALGVQRIVLVGPVPHWIGSLPSNIARVMRGEYHSSVPDRQTKLLDTSIPLLNEIMLQTAESLSLEYVNSYRNFCNSSGCLVTVEVAGKRDLTSFDHAHLTKAASEFLINLNVKKIFGK